MEEPLLFLSHSGEDAGRAQELARLLRGAGLKVWLDVDDLQPGDRWMESIEQAMAQAQAFAVYVGRLGVQRWVDRELRLALSRNAGDARFRVIPILGENATPEGLPPFLKQHHHLDLRGKRDFQDVALALRNLLATVSSAGSLLTEGQAPFRGLERFEAGDSILYFGRDRAVEELLERMKGARVVAVVGASGTGKSSLVRAGLLPALLRGRYTDPSGGTRKWHAAVFRPGDNVFREMASALPQLKPELSDAQRLELRAVSIRHLESAPDDLYGVVSLLTPEGSRSVLVVDQFEELFTHHTSASRDKFVNVVKSTAEALGDREIRFVLTLRADFFSRLWDVPGLVPLLDRRTFLIPPMSAGEISDVVTKPLELAGGDAEPGLVERLLADLGEDPGRLPLLEHGLLQLWKRSTNGVLSHADYDSIDGIRGALRHHAEEVYLGLGQAERDLARAIFLRLVRPGLATAPTRRRAPMEEVLALSEDDAMVARVLARLVDSRLVVSGSNDLQETSQSGPRVVEVVHEVLLENWQRYRDWIAQEMDSLSVEGELREVADRWYASDKDSAYLYTGSRLLAAQRWAADHKAILGERPREFLAQSEAEFETISRLRKQEHQPLGIEWRVRVDAKDWIESERDPTFLYRGSPLKRAQGWAAQNLLSITPEIRDFLEASGLRDEGGSLPAAEERTEEYRLQRELEVARTYQQELLPERWPQVAGASFAGHLQPAHILSGDLQEVMELPDGRVAFWIADCSGKGVPAAMQALTVRAYLRGLSRQLLRVEETVAALNIELSQGSRNRFVTCIYGILDPRTGGVTYVNAGHVAALLVRRNGSIQALEPTSILLGVFPSATFVESSINLESGDLLVVLTDGITEALNFEGEEFGANRVMEILRGAWNLSAAEIVSRLMSGMNAFSGDSVYADDATVLILAKE